MGEISGKAHGFKLWNGLGTLSLAVLSGACSSGDTTPGTGGSAGSAGVSSTTDDGGTKPGTTGCADGTWDDDGKATTACVPYTSCAAGEYITKAGTASPDRTCAACADGHFLLQKMRRSVRHGPSARIAN